MKNKKILLIIPIILIIIITLSLIKKPLNDIKIKDYKLSEDRQTIIITLNNNIKSYKNNNNNYTFYTTYIPIMSTNKLEISLDDNTKEIYFNNNLTLIKDNITNNWIKINYIDNTIVPLLYNLDEIIKVGINNLSQSNNYIEYEEEETIKTIYNIFKDLKTTTVSTTYNPESSDELYEIIFYNTEEQLLRSDSEAFKGFISIYKKDNEYYAEQRYNGIYKITEENFNTIKNYIKDLT